MPTFFFTIRVVRGLWSRAPRVPTYRLRLKLKNGKARWPVGQDELPTKKGAKRVGITWQKYNKHLCSVRWKAHMAFVAKSWRDTEKVAKWLCNFCRASIYCLLAANCDVWNTRCCVGIIHKRNKEDKPWTVVVFSKISLRINSAWSPKWITYVQYEFSTHENLRSKN